MNLPKYDRYKESGVEWLGEIPEHWEILPFKALFKPSNEKNGQNIIGEMLSVSGYRGIEQKQYEYEEQKRSVEDLKDYRVVRKGQLVVNTMWLNYAGLGVSELEGHVSPAYRAYWISERLDKKYIHYLMRSHVYVQGYTGQMQGIRPNSLQIKNVDFFKFPILIPEIAEQKRIAKFLDRKCGEIDEAIRKKQRLIELLEEQKTILINQAVTKGLNPNTPMKDSGIEWLGEIPEHWERIKLKLRHQTTSGGTPPTERREYYNGNIPWIRTLDLNNDKLIAAEVYITNKAIRETACSLVPKDSVLIAMYGGAGTIGKNALLRINSTVNQAVCAILPNSKTLPEYLQYFVKFYRPFWMIGADGTRKDPNISQDSIKNKVFLFPPYQEQVEIAYFLNNKVEEINFLKEKISQQIEKLTELKQILIAEAVTGKIKV